jgi:hypothetical protein
MAKNVNGSVSTTLNLTNVEDGKAAAVKTAADALKTAVEAAGGTCTVSVTVS